MTEADSYIDNHEEQQEIEKYIITYRIGPHLIKFVLRTEHFKPQERR